MPRKRGHAKAFGEQKKIPQGQKNKSSKSHAERGDSSKYISLDLIKINNEKEKSQLMTVFIKAGDYTTIEQLISHGANPHEKVSDDSSNFKTPLMIAVEQNDPQIVNILLKPRMNIFSRPMAQAYTTDIRIEQEYHSFSIIYALQIAALKGSYNILTIILDKIVDTLQEDLNQSQFPSSKQSIILNEFMDILLRIAQHRQDCEILRVLQIIIYRVHALFASPYTSDLQQSLYIAELNIILTIAIKNQDEKSIEALLKLVLETGKSLLPEFKTYLVESIEATLSDFQPYRRRMAFLYHAAKDAFAPTSSSEEPDSNASTEMKQGLGC